MDTTFILMELLVTLILLDLWRWKDARPLSTDRDPHGLTPADDGAVQSPLPDSHARLSNPKIRNHYRNLYDVPHGSGR